MQLVCPRAVLSAAFTVVGAVVPSRTPREILKNVKLDAVASGPGATSSAQLTGTDGDGTSIRFDLTDVECKVGGSALLPTQRLTSILRELTDDTVSLEVNGDAVWLRCGGSEFRLSAEDPADFPTAPEFVEEDYFVVPADVFRRLIKRTLFATDAESTRYALGGVLVEITADQVRMAATDSRRLAVAVGTCSVEGQPVSGSQQPVVPSKAMSLIEKSLGDEATNVCLAIHTNDISIRAGRASITTQLVQGRFPDYRKVIPSRYEAEIDLIASTFLSAVRQSQVVTNEESRGVDFTFAEGTLRLASKAADIGQSKIELPIGYQGSELTIRFDPRFVGDFLRVLEGSSTVHLKLINDESPGVFTTDDDYTYVIMPLSRDS
ncbi:DNA polymerase III subunit beta [Planctopirus ephydatiae]|uniref:Beta sliding clamp n=1 Tax=Planctopirus ephydatiae TaxID=2528019 RepID=A0A518GJX2_9PLAN|nr:DNA polymerase III subunit beta [Planctopirus ephydatiae]QDV28890.1 DNA polymerase III subunit beta [Planctopirus ephydatiae]